eukprot:14376188-Alexandrium_andersonii.AAC.1
MGGRGRPPRRSSWSGAPARTRRAAWRGGGVSGPHPARLGRFRPRGPDPRRDAGARGEGPGRGCCGGR